MLGHINYIDAPKISNEAKQFLEYYLKFMTEKEREHHDNQEGRIRVNRPDRICRNWENWSAELEYEIQGIFHNIFLKEISYESQIPHDEPTREAKEMEWAAFVLSRADMR